MITWMIIQLCNGSEPRGFRWPTQVQVVVRTGNHTNMVLHFWVGILNFTNLPLIFFFCLTERKSWSCAGTWFDGIDGPWDLLDGRRLDQRSQWSGDFVADAQLGRPMWSWLPSPDWGDHRITCELFDNSRASFPDVCLSNRICYHLPAYDNFDIFWRGNDEHPDFEVPNFQFKAIAAIASTAPGWFTGLTERQQNLGAILIGSLVGSLVRWFVSWLRRFQTFHIFPSLFRVDDSTECFFWVGHTADPQDAEHLVGTGARKDEGLWMTGYLGMLWAWPWTLSLDVHEM